MLKRLILLVSAFSLLIPSFSVKAQDDTPEQPVYYVQSGDTLTSIASRFGITTDELINANPSITPDSIRIGDALTIPGIEGVSGVLVTEAVPFGETIRSLSRKYQIPLDLLIKINNITSPSELYAGVNLILPVESESTLTNGRSSLDTGQSLLELAVTQNVDPWTLQSVNTLSGTWDGLPGEALFYPSDSEETSASSIDDKITSFEVSPLPLVQGETTEIKINTTEAITLTGSLAGNELHFFSESPNEYISLQGIHAMLDPGLYPLSLTGTYADGSTFSFEQMVIVEYGGYVSEVIAGVDPETLDPTVTKPENELIKSVVQYATPTRYWSGMFLVPGYDPEWITSWYGTRRTYNDDTTVYFHTGLDYGGGTGLPVTSPAAGIVVYTGELTVRGNATIIDHGWGVYSGFWHQSEIQVNVGDKVEAGQQIGLIGGTGRVTGAHLHWEVWVNGIQVNPYDWLETDYP